jgi:hypothetical protein
MPTQIEAEKVTRGSFHNLDHRIVKAKYGILEATLRMTWFL